MLLLIAPCVINYLTRFVTAQVNKLQHAEPVQQGYIKLQLTTENITHPYALVFLPRESPWTEVGYSPWGRKETDTAER